MAEKNGGPSQMLSGMRKRKPEPSNLSSPSQAWETELKRAVQRARRHCFDPYLQCSKVKLLPADMSQEYGGRAGQITQHQRALTALAEDQVRVSSTPIGKLTITCDSSPKSSNVFSWPQEMPMPMDSCPYTNMHTHTNKKKS